MPWGEGHEAHVGRDLADTIQWVAWALVIKDRNPRIQTGHRKDPIKEVRKNLKTDKKNTEKKNNPKMHKQI